MSAGGIETAGQDRGKGKPSAMRCNGRGPILFTHFYLSAVGTMGPSQLSDGVLYGGGCSDACFKSGKASHRMLWIRFSPLIYIVFPRVPLRSLFLSSFFFEMGICSSMYCPAIMNHNLLHLEGSYQKPFCDIGTRSTTWKFMYQSGTDDVVPSSITAKSPPSFFRFTSNGMVFFFLFIQMPTTMHTEDVVRQNFGDTTCNGYSPSRYPLPCIGPESAYS